MVVPTKSATLKWYKSTLYSIPSKKVVQTVNFTRNFTAHHTLWTLKREAARSFETLTPGNCLHIPPQITNFPKPCQFICYLQTRSATLISMKKWWNDARRENKSTRSRACRSATSTETKPRNRTWSSAVWPATYQPEAWHAPNHLRVNINPHSVNFSGCFLDASNDQA